MVRAFHSPPDLGIGAQWHNRSRRQVHEGSVVDQWLAAKEPAQQGKRVVRQSLVDKLVLPRKRLGRAATWLGIMVK